MSGSRISWRRWLRSQVNRYRVHGKTKYFCIGRNKTGTTSLKMAFQQMGFVVGDQRIGKILADMHYFEGRFEKIVRYCHTAEVFQDAPFSYPETYKVLDQAFPGSKFILTERDSPEQWYQSLVSFHAKRFGNGKVPTYEDLRQFELQGKIQGLTFNFMKIHGTPLDDIYNRDITIAHYQRYNQEIKDYFRDRPEDLLVINISKSSDYQRFLQFVDREDSGTSFPWVNRTSDAGAKSSKRSCQIRRESPGSSQIP